LGTPWLPHRQANKPARFERLFHDKLLGPPRASLGHLAHCLELPTKEMFPNFGTKIDNFFIIKKRVNFRNVS